MRANRSIAVLLALGLLSLPLHAAAQEKPATPESKPAATESKPVEPEAKPAAPEAKPAAEKEAEAAPDPDYPIVDAKPHNRSVCFYVGTFPQGKYRYATLRRISVAKKAYGAVESLYPGMAETARKAGADMVIDIKITTRHSMVVWRMATPVADGLAIKFADDSPKPDCAELGGRFY